MVECVQGFRNGPLDRTSNDGSAAIQGELEGCVPAMDQAFPAANRLGIPDLDVTMGATSVPLPVWCWGQTGRRRPNLGTWHHYTDDYRFSSVEKRPCNLIDTGCAAAVEVNYSVFDDTPLAVAFWTIYKKRYIARLWQRLCTPTARCT